MTCNSQMLNVEFPKQNEDRQPHLTRICYRLRLTILPGKLPGNSHPGIYSKAYKFISHLQVIGMSSENQTYFCFYKDYHLSPNPLNFESNISLYKYIPYSILKRWPRSPVTEGAGYRLIRPQDRRPIILSSPSADSYEYWQVPLACLKKNRSKRRQMNGRDGSWKVKIVQL